MAKKKKVPKHAPRKKDSAKRIPSKKTARQKASVHKSERQQTKGFDKATRARLRYALNLVRKHIKGYSAKDGFSVRALESGELSKGRVKTLLKKSATLKELLRQPHDLIRVPKNREGQENAKARHSLVSFTRQKIRKAKHFIVHKPADNFDVRLVRDRVVVRGTFAGKVRGKRRSKVVSETSYFLFPKTVKHPDDAERMLRDMLADMPEGYYVMLTGAHGDTGEPVDKGQLINRLRQYINAYQFAMTTIEDSRGKPMQKLAVDQKFAQSIAGFRLLSTTVDGMELQMQARDIRRQRQAEYNQKRRLELMGKKEREEYEAPQKLERSRQARRKAALKGAATRRKKARAAARKTAARKHK